MVKVRGLDEKLSFINDLLWCSIRSLNVKLCEYVMQQFVYETRLQNLVPMPLSGPKSELESQSQPQSNATSTFTLSSNSSRPSSNLTTSSNNTNPSTNLFDKLKVQVQRVQAQLSTHILSKFLTTVDYVPLQKMVVVALLHPYSPLTDQLKEMEKRGNEFIMTPSLNAIDRMILS